ncbi:DUF1767 domain containing protein [Pseudohyphozyma bogoriensis]|nr:DUF1767 domain containing protein [Pseudohyphozyma bogoriensis]
MAGVPPAVVGWFKSAYPQNSLDPEWLSACYDYLNTHFPNTPAPQLIKLVESQLLQSDLSTSTLAPRSSRFPTPLPTQLFPGVARQCAVLVQVVAIDEVGFPALGIYDTLKSKRDARGVPVKIKVGDEDENGAEGEFEDKEGVYPRGLVRITVSDGFSEVEGFERKRVNGLGLEECGLGTKLMLQNIKTSRGLLLLEPTNCVVKGGGVEEFEALKEKQLERRLRERLGMPPLPPDEPAPAAAQPPPQPNGAPVDNDDNGDPHSRSPSPAPQPPAPRQRRRSPPLQPARAAPRVAPPAPAPGPAPKPKSKPKPEPRSPSPNYDDFLPDIDEAELGALGGGGEGGEFELDEDAEMEVRRIEEEFGRSQKSEKAKGKGKGKEKVIEELELEGLDVDMEWELDDDEAAPVPPPEVVRPVKKEPKGKEWAPGCGGFEEDEVPEPPPLRKKKKKVEVLELGDSDGELQVEDRKPVIVRRVELVKKVKTGEGGGGGGGAAEVIVLD